jgi:hypothetical protein
MGGHSRGAAKRLAILFLAGAAVPMIGLAAPSAPRALADPTPLQTVMDWTPFPADAPAPGAVFADSPDRIGLALSMEASAPVTRGGPTGWTRAQLVSLDNGRPTSALFTVPTFAIGPYSPYWMDEARGLFIYAAPKALAGTGTPAPTWDIVGISMRGARHIAFDVPSRFVGQAIVALTPTDDGRDLVLVANADKQGIASGTGIAIDRVSIAGLQKGNLQARWQQPYRPAPSICPSLISTLEAPAVLAFADKVAVGCRQASLGADSSLHSGASRTLPGVAVFSGLDASTGATGDASFFPAAGNFNINADSFADRADQRLVLTDQNAEGIGARVFDVVHERYVGRVPLGQKSVVGAVVDQKTGRFYVASPDPQVGLALADLRAIVPTQGLLVPQPYYNLFARGDVRVMGYDDVRHNVLIPVREGAANHVVVVHDSSSVYVPPAAANPDAGALDVPEQPGITDSQRSAVAQAYGADYQLIGGLNNLAPDNQIPAGTNFLRQAEVVGATLTSDESTAQSVLATEDQITDQNRECAGVTSQVPCVPVPAQAGLKPTFADAAGCSDFGGGATKGRVYKDTAYVSCDHTAEKTEAGSSFVSDGALFMTSNRTEPVAAPVQVSRSSTEVSLQRAPGLGAVTTTVTATADGISMLGAVRIGSVSTEIRLVTHGRPGTSSVDRKVVVNDVSVGGVTICSRNCSSDAVQSAINTVQPGRLRVDFPEAQQTKSPRGTFVGVVQDPWYHAERVLDGEKIATDYAVPAMTITVNLDSGARSRLVVDLAAASATDSYRIYNLGKQAPFLPPLTGKIGRPAPLDLPGTRPGSLPTPPAPPVLAQSGGFGAALANAARFLLGSPGRMLALLPVFLLLGVPVYLSARRRLLLELPLLSRDEGLS